MYSDNVKLWTVWFDVTDASGKTVMHDIDVLAATASCAVNKAADMFYSDMTPELFQVFGFESAVAEEVIDEAWEAAS